MADILVVDNDAGILKVTEALLKAEGHTVTLAAGIPAAQAELTAKAFDVAVVDFVLGQGKSAPTGIDLAEWVHSTGNPAKVIMRSGFPESQLRHDARYATLEQAGVIRQYVEKPSPKQVLLDAITAAITPSSMFTQSPSTGKPQPPGPTP